ncbi:MAG: hypothetical protein GY751_17115 [Bacteroidetes bacterium]|nr:hypothetical protein [Bacteroidota bacterium]
MKGIYFLLIFGAFTTLQAGNDFNAKGAEANAYGNHSTTLVNAFSTYNNQGAAAFLEQPSFGLSYQSSYWPANITDLTVSAAGPISFGTIGGSVNYFGNDLYYEMKAGIAYAMHFGDKVGFGVQLDYLHSKAKSYGGRHFVTFEVGILYRPITQVSVGAHIYNPVKYKVDDVTHEILPIVMDIGIQYKPHEKITIVAEFEKDLDHPFSVKGGFGYQVIEALSVRGGFSTQPTVLFFGLGYLFKDVLLIDAGSNYHLDLGFNTALSLSFVLNKKDEQ